MAKSEGCGIEPGSLNSIWNLLTDATVSRTRHLEGQLCTFIDATTGDERQAKAAKDIVKTLLWDYEKGIEVSIERSLYIYFLDSSKRALVPQWLEKRFRAKEIS